MMNDKTVYEDSLDRKMLYNYFSVLVNRFFKILPIREQENESYTIYVKSLLSELLGCKGLVYALDNDPDFTTLLFILQYLADNGDVEVSSVRREVFRSISICNKLKSRYSDADTKKAVVENV